MAGNVGLLKDELTFRSVPSPLKIFFVMPDLKTEFFKSC